MIYTIAMAASGAQAVEGGSFPPFDASTFPSQILWLVITFGLFYLFIERVATPRISGILEVRRDRIAQDLDQAARMKTEADEAIAAYEQDLAEARQKAGEIAAKARDKAKADAEAERLTAETELDKKLTDAEQRIAGIKASALGEVDTIANETVSSIVEHLVGQKPGRKDITDALNSLRK